MSRYFYNETTRALKREPDDIRQRITVAAVAVEAVSQGATVEIQTDTHGAVEGLVKHTGASGEDEAVDEHVEIKITGPDDQG